MVDKGLRKKKLVKNFKNSYSNYKTKDSKL